MNAEGEDTSQYGLPSCHDVAPLMKPHRTISVCLIVHAGIEVKALKHHKCLPCKCKPRRLHEGCMLSNDKVLVLVHEQQAAVGDLASIVVY